MTLQTVLLRKLEAPDEEEEINIHYFPVRSIQNVFHNLDEINEALKRQLGHESAYPEYLFTKNLWKYTQWIKKLLLVLNLSPNPTLEPVTFDELHDEFTQNLRSIQRQPLQDVLLHMDMYNEEIKEDLRSGQSVVKIASDLTNFVEWSIRGTDTGMGMYSDSDSSDMDTDSPDSKYLDFFVSDVSNLSEFNLPHVPPAAGGRKKRHFF